MKQYLLSIYQPDGDPPPSVDLDRIRRYVAALNEEMKAAGSIRAQSWPSTARWRSPRSMDRRRC
jgi:hypothetical protein